MALHRKTKSTDDAPMHPFYKDEHLLGKHLTVSVSFRFLLVALIGFALVVGFVAFRLVDDQARLKSYVREGHQSRLEDQARADKKTDDLACFIVASIPDDPARPAIALFRSKYHCPPYGQDPNFKDFGTAATPPATSAPSSSAGSPSKPGSLEAPKTGSPNTGTPGGTSAQVSAPKPTQTSHAPGTSSAAPAATSAPSPHVSLPVQATLPGLVGVGGSSCAVNALGICVLK